RLAGPDGSSLLERYANADPRGARCTRGEEAGIVELVAEHLIRLPEYAERLVLGVEHVVDACEKPRRIAQRILAAKRRDRIAADLVDKVAFVAPQMHGPARQHFSANREPRRRFDRHAGLEQAIRDQRQRIASFDRDLTVDGERMMVARHEQCAAERRLDARKAREPARPLADAAARI